MRIEQVFQTYDAYYAGEYDETFLLDTWSRASVEFQLQLLASHLEGADAWLDVACGTGWVLSQFPDQGRTGLDISGPMLDAARRKNPGVEFAQRDYRQPWPEWNDRFDVVSCMWWAYCMAETMGEIRQLVARLADWVTPAGSVILPLCNPNKFDRHTTRIPYIDARVPGRCMITGITWTWIQENGKRHDDVLSPQVEHMVAMFRQHFEQVDVVEGPLDLIGEGWRVQDVLVARRKRADRQDGDLYPSIAGAAAGTREWLLGVTGDALAGLGYPDGDLDHVRVAIQRVGGEPWNVQVNRSGYTIRRGAQYRLRFRCRADTPRSIGVGLAHGAEPWTALGYYETLDVGPEWRPVDRLLVAEADSARGRIHFDVGIVDGGIELAGFSFELISPPAGP